jgi:hypothetical protein
MKSLRRLAMGGLLLALGACFVACGGDDSATPGAGGSAGSGGTGGAGGKGGSAGSGGRGGSGGSATAGSAGTGGSGQAGTAGSAGAGGNAGASGSAGSGGATADASSDAPLSDAPKDGATPDVSQDAPSSSDAGPETGAPDATGSDATQGDTTQGSDSPTSDASDAGSAQETGPEASTSCPVSQPANDSNCTDQVLCVYGDGDVACICRTLSAGVRHWTCTGADASSGANCPMMRPRTDDAGMYGPCSDAGSSFSCRYGNTWCFCNEGLSTNNTWACL